MPYDDRAAFVAAAARTAADLANCRVLGARARTSVLALDWDGIAAQVEGVMGSVIARKAAQPEGYAFASARHSSV